MILRLKSRYIAAVIISTLFVCVQAEAPTAPQDVENTLRRFLAAMSSRDTAELRLVLHSQVSIIKAGRSDAKIGAVNVRNGAELLPPVGNRDWDTNKIKLSAVKVEISATHPSVAMVSFSLDFQLGDKEVDGLRTALKNSPAEFSEQQAKEIRKRIADRAVKNAAFAMFGKQAGEWKIVSISLPQ